MPEKSANEQVWARLPEATVRRLGIRAAELGINRPKAVAQAITEWLDGARAQPQIERPAPQPQLAAPSLTEDQRDLLAIIAEDPDKALLFKSLQTLVQHALEEYRTKWKPKKKAAAKGAHDDRRSTGT